MPVDPDDLAEGLVLSLPDLEARIAAMLEGLKGKSVETVGTYRRALNEFVRFFAQQQGAFRFRPEDAEAYKTYLMEERGLHQVSVSTYLTALRRLCGYLVDTGALGANPAKSVKGNRRPSSHTRSVLTQAEVETFVQRLPSATLLNLRDRALALMMLYNGLAEIELVRADVGDVTTDLLGTFLRVQGKGHTVKDQQVPLDARAYSALRAYLDLRGPTPGEAPLFAAHGHRAEGTRLNTRSVRTRMVRLLREADLRRPSVTPHSLTHTAALLWLAEGVPIDEVRRRMRHGTLDTTMIYARQQGLLGKTPEEVTRIVRSRIEANGA